MTKRYNVEIAADQARLIASFRAADAALGSSERAYGSLAQAQARAGAASVRFVEAQRAEMLAVLSTAKATQAVAGMREAAVDPRARAVSGIRQTADAQAVAAEQAQGSSQQRRGDEFLRGLQNTAAAAGRTRAEYLALQAAQLGLAEKAQPYITKIAEADRKTQSFNKTGRLTALELQQVGFQLNDLAVQVASGQSPITALIQQGSQLSGTFGGIMPALRAVGSLITPAVVGFGALAVVVGSVGLAYAQADGEDRRFRDGLVLTGNAAGVTRDSMNSLAVSVQAASGITIGAAREITQGLVETGQIGPGALGAVAQAAATLARVSGKSADEVVKDFAGLANGAAKWALEKNKAYNFLTAETYRYIKTLEAQGKVEEAQRVASSALDEALKGRTRQLGLIEEGWNGVKKAATGAWDAMLNVGRADTSGDDAAQLLANLAVARERLAQAERRGTSEGGGPGEPGLARRRAIVEAFEAQLENIRLLQRAEREAAGQSAATAAKNREDLTNEEEAKQQALASLQRSGLALQQAKAAAEREKEMVAVERSYDLNILGLAGYARARGQLEQQIIDAKRAAIDQDIALERKRQVAGDKTPEGVQRQARITDLQARRAALLSEQVRLNAQIDNKFGKKPREDDGIGDAEAAFNRRIQDFAARNQTALDRVEEQERTSADARRQTNQELAVSLIADDERRGQAQIAMEVERLRKQIELEQLAGQQRMDAEAAVADFIALRNAQLAEQLKPQWQRMTEGWADATKLMRETGDAFMTGFLQQGEQTWLEFTRTGKLSLAEFGNFVRDELARFTYRQFVAPAVTSIGKSIADTLGIKVPGAGGDVAQQAARAAETSALATNTTALQAMQTLGVNPSVTALASLAGAANAATAALAQVAGGSSAPGLLGSLGSLFGGDGGGFSLGNGGLGSDLGGAEFDLTGLFGFAKGGAFDRSGQVAQRFAKGGAFANRVVTEPTLFRFARGAALGEMGEAGPEGIFPLRRNGRGELGVQAMGGAAAPAPVFNLHFQNAPQVESTQRRRNATGGEDVFVKFKAQIKAEMAEDVSSGTGDMGKAISGRFGLNGGAGLIR